MRIYCDSNIFRLIDPNHKKFDSDLLLCLEKLNDVLLFIYSEAHINDLKKSKQPHLDANIDIMTKYVQDNYFARDYIYKRDEILLAYPREVYDNKDFKLIDKILDNPKEEIEKILNRFEDDNVYDLLNHSIKFPLTQFKVDESLFDQADLAYYSKIVGSSNISELIGNMFEGSFSHLEDNKWIKKLKKSLGYYIHINEYSFNKWEHDFEKKLTNERTISNILKKMDLGIDTKPIDEFSRFTNFYIKLEILGITKEKVGNKTKDFNFMSLLTDASHAYFASKCDYLVSADIGVLIKSFMSYSKALGFMP